MTFIREWPNFIPYRTEQWEEIRGDMNGWIKLRSASPNMNSVVSVIISFENVNNFNGFYPHRLNTDADTKAE